MESDARSASSCLCESWNRHRRPHKPCTHNRQHKNDSRVCGNNHINSSAASPEASSLSTPEIPVDGYASLQLIPEPHKNAKCENCSSCDKSSSIIPSPEVQGPQMLLKDSSAVRQRETGKEMSKSHDGLNDCLNRLKIKSGRVADDSPETTRRKCSLPTVSTADAKEDKLLLTTRRCSSDEFVDSTRIAEVSDNGKRNRVPRIRYNVSKDSCTVTPSSERPIYPSLPYSPICSPSSSPNLQRCEGQKESKRMPPHLQCSSSYTQLHQYKVLGEIGRGSYGVVKLAYSEEDHNYYAMKILSKKKLMRRAGLYGRMPPRRDGQKLRSSPLEQISREIAILKKLNHVNIVKLFEVLNESDGDNLYMVFELVEHGPVMQLPTKNPLSEEKAWEYFRDIVMGIEYLHFQKIIHRDIKPSNLLLSDQGRIQISDFGVCNQFEGVDAFLSDTSGTPAFVAPEALKGTRARYSGKALDIWQMGVSLYSFVLGHVPYDDPNVLALYTKIRSDPLYFPPEPSISDALKDLLEKMLEKDPDHRIKLKEIKNHRWVTKDGLYPLPVEEANRTFVEVTEEEINNSMRPVPKLDTLVLIKSMLKKHSFSHPFKESPECHKYDKLLTHAVRGDRKKTLRKITTCPNVPTFKCSADERKGNEET